MISLPNDQTDTYLKRIREEIENNLDVCIYLFNFETALLLI